MAHKFIPTGLHGGGRVTLVEWEDESPTAHGADLQAKPWNASHPRKGVGFYESTIQYMRNDWAQAHMSPTHVRVGRQDLLLFHNAATDTWHSADALDIDHARKWKDHLSALKVDNYADANRAYNDVSNLRLLPSPINRARERFETMLDEHGNDSPQAKAWVKKHFAFDPDAAHPAFDEDRDLARRTAATTGSAWSPDDGRKGLSFDTRVLDKWYDHQLKESYVDTVEMTSPTTGKVTKVPLFQCAATGQLATRDALDIDHEVPFETLATEMVKYAEGGQLTKANASDAYNETSNLRLVSRSANSSHEWELDQFGHYYDDEDDPELPGEFDDFIDDSEFEVAKPGAKAAPAMSAIASAPLRAAASSDAPPFAFAAPSSPPFAFGAPPAAASFGTPQAPLPAFGSVSLSSHSPFGAPWPSSAPYSPFGTPSPAPYSPFGAPSSSLAAYSPFGTLPPASHSPFGAPSPSAFGMPMGSAAAKPPLSATALLMNDARHPDHPLFAQALKGLQSVPDLKLTPTQLANGASSLAWVAKANQMTAIDQVACSDGKLFVVQNPHSPGRQVASAQAHLAIGRSVADNTAVIDKLPAPAKPSAPGHGPAPPLKH